MKFGTEIMSVQTGDIKVSTIAKYHKDVQTSLVKQYEIRVKVKNYDQELAELIEFRKQLFDLRETLNGHPSFTYEFPQKDVDGTYFIIKSYSVIV